MKIKFENKFILYVFFGLYFLIGLVTYGDYGINIEEHTQRYSGFYWLNYVVNFFEIESLKENVLDHLNKISSDYTLPNPQQYTYGTIFDLPTAFADVVFNIKESSFYFEYRHFLVFLIFFLSSIFFFSNSIRKI